MGVSSLFTTLRSYTKQKYKYYKDKEGHVFNVHIKTKKGFNGRHGSFSYNKFTLLQVLGPIKYTELSKKFLMYDTSGVDYVYKLNPDKDYILLLFFNNFDDEVRKGRFRLK